MSEKISVKGIAIKPGISKNGIRYTKEELEMFAPTLTGKPFLKDHNSTVDNTVGVVENSGSMGEGTVAYNGWVKDDGNKLVEKIKDGRIKEVSIGAFCRKLVKESDDDEYATAIGLEGMELSLTPTPAMRGTSLSMALESIEEHKQNEKIKVLPISESISSINKVEPKKKDSVDVQKLKNKIQDVKVKTEKLKNKTNQSIKKRKEVNKMTEEKIKELQEALEAEKKAKEALETEMKESSEQLTQAKEKIAKVKEARLNKLVKEYKELAESKKIEPVNVSKMKESSVKALIETLKQMKVEDKKTEPKGTHGKVVKNNAEDDEEVKESLGQYNLEESAKGSSLWKHPNADGTYTKRGE